MSFFNEIGNLFGNETTVPNKETKQSSNPQDLFLQGKELCKNENYEEACQVLSQALEIIVSSQENSESVNVVPFYVEYGRALLRYTQMNNDVFGSVIREKQKEETEKLLEKDGDEENNNEGETSIEENDNQIINPETSNNNNSNELVTKTDDNNQEMEEIELGEENENDSNDGDSNKDEGVPDIDTTEDREIAWQSLEAARIILEKYLAKESNKEHKLMLAEIHSLLGELELEDESFNGAYDDFLKSLKLREECNESFRELAYCHFMAALAASYLQNDQLSTKHFSSSLKMFQDKIIDILKNQYNYPIILPEENKTENDDFVAKKSESVLIGLEEFFKSDESKDITQESKNELDDLKKNIDEILFRMKEKPEQFTMENLMELMKEPLPEGDKEEEQSQGITTIGFTDYTNDENKDISNETIHELGFIKKKKNKNNNDNNNNNNNDNNEISPNSVLRKRTQQEAEIELPNCKKIKANPESSTEDCDNSNNNIDNDNNNNNNNNNNNLDDSYIKNQ